MEHGGDNADLGEAGGPRRAWDFKLRKTGQLLAVGHLKPRPSDPSVEDTWEDPRLKKD